MIFSKMGATGGGSAKPRLCFNLGRSIIVAPDYSRGVEAAGLLLLDCSLLRSSAAPSTSRATPGRARLGARRGQALLQRGAGLCHLCPVRKSEPAGELVRPK